MEREQVIVTRDKLRDVLEQKERNVKIGKIVYYNDFDIVKEDENHSAFSEQDIFVVTCKTEKDGLQLEYYEIYDEKFNLIATTDGNNEMQYSDEYIKKLGPMYKHLGLDKRKMYLNKENEFVVYDKPKEELVENDIEEIKQKEEVYQERKVDAPEPALIEEDLGISRSSISYCQEIKDKRFFDMVPESAEFSKTAMLIYSSELETFMIVGVKDGKYQPYNTIEPAKSTLKPVNDLGRDGENIKKGDAITGILNFKGSREYDFSVDIEPNGRIEFQQLRRDFKTGEVVTADLETDVQYRAYWEVEQMMKKETNKDISDEMEKLEESDGNVGVEDIKDKDEEEEEEIRWDRDPRRR